MKDWIIAIVLVAIVMGIVIGMQPVPEDIFFTVSESDVPFLYISANDSSERAVTWDYNYAGKIWKYWTIINATCHQVVCECAKNTPTPCMAYCMECEDETQLREDTMETDCEKNLCIDDTGKIFIFPDQEAYEKWKNATTIEWEYNPDGTVNIESGD